jgi:hypothetical protein
VRHIPSIAKGCGELAQKRILQTLVAQQNGKEAFVAENGD